MALNEAMLANLTADELVHYSRCTPGLMKQVSTPHFLGSVADRMEALEDEVAELTSEVKGYEAHNDEHVCKPLYYYTWQETHQAVEDVTTELGIYCEDNGIQDDHPLKAILHDLEDACRQVRELY